MKLNIIVRTAFHSLTYAVYKDLSYNHLGGTVVGVYSQVRSIHEAAQFYDPRDLAHQMLDEGQHEIM